MYLKLVVWPWPLLIHYDFAYFKTLSQAWMYVLPVLLLGMATLWLLWRNDPIGYLGTWMFAILSPTLVIPITTEMAAERRMYLPLAAILRARCCRRLRLASNSIQPLVARPTFAIWRKLASRAYYSSCVPARDCLRPCKRQSTHGLLRRANAVATGFAVLSRRLHGPVLPGKLACQVRSAGGSTRSV